MRIRKIDLYGFKSFPDRTTLVLDEGISCVVGPNGCGKSNIVDAIKWCVGEQSVRSLRGGEMSDVIFAGSSDRPPVGYAEVVLTFTSEGGEPFPGDHAARSELQIGRRLHRSGTSEYLINQSRVRRRDVVELFLDTGVGNNLYSVIEQGRIGKIVHASHDERRQLIDEAAGISRYKHKRDESTKRLEATAAQLDRAADVAEEMGRRSRTLERQVIKAERFRRLRAQLRQEEIALSLARYAALSADRRALRKDLHQTRAELAGADRELARVRADLQLRRDEIASAEEAVDTWRDEVAERDARRRELEGERSWLSRELEELERREVREVEVRTRAASEVEEAEVETRESLERARAVQGEIEALAQRSTAVEAEVALEREVLQQARDALEAVTAELAGARARQDTAASTIAALDQRLAELPQVELAAARAGDEPELRVAEAEATLAELRRGEVQARRVLLEAEGALAEAQLGAATQEADAISTLHRAEERAEARIRAAEETHRVASSGLREALDARLAATAAELEDRASERAEAHRAGLAAWEEGAEARSASLRAALDREAEEAEAGRSGEETRTRDEGRSAVDTRREQVSAEIEAHSVSAHAEVERCRAARDLAARTRETLLEEGHRAKRELGDRRARHLGLREQLRAVERTQAGSEGVREALGVPLLADLLPLDRAERLAPILGERLLAPVVTEVAQVVRALEVSGDLGPASVLFSPGADPVEALLERTRVVEGVAEALASPGAVAVTADGLVRAEADGLVRLGGTAAGDALRLRRDRSILDGEVTDAEVRHARLVQEAQAAAATLEATGHALVEAEAHLATVAEEGRALLAAADGAARELAEAQVAGVLQRHQEQRAAWQLERRQRLDALRAELELERAAMEGEARVASAAHRREDARALALARERGEAALVHERAVLDLALEDARGAAREEVAGARASLDATRRDPGHAPLVATLERAREGAARARQVLDDAEVTLAACQRSLAASQLDEARHRSAALEVTRSQRHGTVQEASATVAAAEAERTRVHSERAALDERLRALGAAAEGHRERASRALERRDTQDRLLSELEITREARLARQVEVEEALGRVQREYGESSERLLRERERLEGLRTGVRSAETRATHQEERRTEMAQRSTELEGRVAEVRTDLDEVKGRMDERYQVSLAGLLDRVDAQGAVDLEPDPRLAEELRVGRTVLEAVQPMRLDGRLLEDEERILALVDRARQHRRQVDAAGELNLAAVEEYREVFGRHRELELQRADLEESVTRIRAAIARMNRLCRQRFRDTFDRVDEHFRETYPRLVGGGSARLSLTDEDDLLDTGVEILVQPPGKRLQNLHLLSGGEKAMCAIALILALFRVKPAPFCIMDEVDAPLDEANGARFNEMLHEMSAVSQFILVTHNRRTMGYADVLYGVTMPTPGVSRLVSVRVD